MGQRKVKLTVTSTSGGHRIGVMHAVHIGSPSRYERYEAVVDNLMKSSHCRMAGDDQPRRQMMLYWIR
jgi:hypothetical protein